MKPMQCELRRLNIEVTCWVQEKVSARRECAYHTSIGPSFTHPNYPNSSSEGEHSPVSTPSHVKPCCEINVLRSDESFPLTLDNLLILVESCAEYMLEVFLNDFRRRHAVCQKKYTCET